MKHIQLIKSLQHEAGFFSAAPTQSTGYNRIWIRDTAYMALGLLYSHPENAVKALHSVFDILKKHEYKIDSAIKEKPLNNWEYIHPIYTHDMEEIEQEWGWKQHDAIGLFLFVVSNLELIGFGVFRDARDVALAQKLVFYLESIEYWHNPDNGMWETEEEVHVSSIGACTAALNCAKHILYVPEWLILKGKDALNTMLPRESVTKESDLSQLSLIYPYGIVSSQQACAIIEQIENKLLRNNGVIRYFGDYYYNNGSEAEWCFGLSWLSIVHSRLGNYEKAQEYNDWLKDVMADNDSIPELYYGQTNKYNKNTPLGWAHSMHIIARYMLR